MNDTSSTNMAIDEELYPALIQCFFIIAVGYIAGGMNLLTNTQSIGLSRYISNFALPAVIFKNLVNVQFQSLSWAFLASVFIAKTIVFICTAVLTCIAERPRNFASIGLYAIMTSQSNDFALILPIINAVYKQSHPDYERYIYLIAPISLVILNPIGIILIEIQKRFEQRDKHRGKHPFQLIKVILYNISRNPIVICTLLGVIFNRIFNEKLPNTLDFILTPVAQSFSATALFYLGLTMVGKLSRLHSHLVITVVILSMVKLILFPLILRQAIFFLLKPINGSLNNTIDYSNFGFLYGTAPTAPSVIFYVPESNLALQAIASTALVVSTLLAGPIMLVSAKMINLKTLDLIKAQSYDAFLVKTSYDVSVMSLLCTIIVLIGFCLRRRLLKISFVHKYTFIFVGVQMIQAIWTIGTQYIELPISTTAATIVELGNILTAFLTRAWATSISIALMISICYSKERARQYWWLYHLYGWLLPIFTVGVIYIESTIMTKNEDSKSRLRKIDTVQYSAAIVLLAICIITISTNLLRIARRTYQLKHDANESDSTSLNSNEIRPLIDEESEDIQRQLSINSTSSNITPLEADTQLFRHAVLVGLLCTNAFICVSVLLWSIVVTDRDGIYYELQFLDTTLLHGQGIITFLVFALDAELLIPIRRKIIKFLRYIGINIKCYSDNHKTIQTCKHLDFEHKIRPDFIRHSVSTQSMSNSLDTIGTIFNGNDFCQWLVSNNYIENESKANDYCQELMTNKHIVCINRIRNEQLSDSTNNWYAFSK
ncbi:unnamed protein product [Adineta steineri]|uniref:DEP domain-containing protein n=1 Tax=Adineta steineri TaxID=433720 RepID=A0A818LHF0_9BILA|nr:unnamed protein product [Adineta steineri]